jgi:hypothetical protein
MYYVEMNGQLDAPTGLLPEELSSITYSLERRAPVLVWTC